MDQELINLFMNNGFAIFVAVYILMRLEKTIKINTELVRDLTRIIKSNGRTR
jgi:hypothetical protein